MDVSHCLDGDCQSLAKKIMTGPERKLDEWSSGVPRVVFTIFSTWMDLARKDESVRLTPALRWSIRNSVTYMTVVALADIYPQAKDGAFFFRQFTCEAEFD